jgi:hypothetical protein
LVPFSEITSRHENRASNCEVHRLSWLATSFSVGRQVWLLQPPNGLCIPNNIINQLVNCPCVATGPTYSIS